MIICKIKDFTLKDDEGEIIVSGEVWVGNWEGDMFSYAVWDKTDKGLVLGGTGSASKEEFKEMVIWTTEIAL